MPAPTSLVPFPPIPESNRIATNQAFSSAADHLIVQANLAQTQKPPISAPPPSPASGPHKEAAPISHQEMPPIIPETAQLIEVREAEPLPEEVEGWLQKLDQEGDIHLDKPITHDGEILLADTEAQVVKEKIVLPLSQTGVQRGLSQKVTDSARWLAEWCIRLIKMMKDKVKYAPEQIKST